jgi:predicted transposase YdaD
VKSDYDSPWKDILETHFQPALELCFPAIARQINWAKGVQLLSQEFQKLVRRSELGRRNVDVLVQVWTVEGRAQRVLLHVEVQAQRDPDFPRRMFDYHSRICQRYQRPVASLAILADEHPNWKPARFQQALWGCESQLRFPVCKLLDLARNETRLLRNPNPFAIVVLAQIKALQTKGLLRQRRPWKTTLARLGYERNYPKRTILDLFSFVDWIIVLPQKLEREFDREHAQYEDSKSMKYVTNIERRGRAEGRAEGRTEGRAEALRTAALDFLEARFGELPYELREELQALDSEAMLQRLPRLAAVVTDLDDFRRQLKSL